MLRAARTEFARHGLYGASIERIAAEADISQPYVFRLFGTRHGLFLAVVERAFDEAFALARAAESEAPRENLLAALGRTWLNQMESDADALLLFLQVLAACGDPEARASVRRRYGELYHWVELSSGANPEAVRTLFAYLMLAAAAAAMRLPEIATPESWADRLLGVLDAFD